MGGKGRDGGEGGRDFYEQNIVLADCEDWTPQATSLAGEG